MRKHKKISTGKVAGASLLIAGLVAASAAPASALSLNVSLGGSNSPGANQVNAGPASVHSLTTINPAAHRTTVSIGQPVSAQSGGTGTPAVTASVGASADAVESGDVSGAADVSIAALLQNVGTAEVVSGGTVGSGDVLNGSDAVDGSANLALNLALGNGFAGGMPGGPSTPGSSVPGTAPASSGNTSGGSSASTGSSNAGAAGSAGSSASSVQGSGSGSGNGSVTVTPGSTTPGFPDGGGTTPTGDAPCSSNLDLGALVALNADGSAVATDAADQAGRVAGTVIGKVGLDLCTISLNLDADGLVSVDSIGNGQSLIDLGNANDQLGDLVNVNLDDVDTNGLNIDVDTDTSNGNPLLSIR